MIGADIVHLKRIRELLLKHPLSLPKKLLNPVELQIYSRFTDHRRQIEFLGGRLAAKESLLKAGISLRLFETLRLDICSVQSSGFTVSISHDGDYAFAVAIDCNKFK
jgi:phosphopantetheine--protein transferase-like protein